MVGQLEPVKALHYWPVFWRTVNYQIRDFQKDKVMETKETPYEFDGEKFFVDDKPGVCAATVTDQYGKTATISVSITSHRKYYVSTEGSAAGAQTEEEALDAACRALIRSRDLPTKESACEDLHKFIQSLQGVPQPSEIKSA